MLVLQVSHSPARSNLSIMMPDHMCEQHLLHAGAIPAMVAIAAFRPLWVQSVKEFLKPRSCRLLRLDN